MADAADPLPPSSPAPAPTPGPEATESSTGLPTNVAAALAALPVVGFVFYFLEKRDQFVRFYAMQSMVYTIAWFLFWIVYNIARAILTSIPLLGGIFAAVLWAIWAIASIAFLLIVIVAVVKALSGSRWHVPYLGEIAQRQMGGRFAA
jgi:uncharacterized membrane protein